MTRSVALAVAALVSLPTSALAGSPYLGLEAGILSGRESDIDEHVEYHSSGTPNPDAPAGEEFDDVLSVGYKSGHDIGIAGGYDFGWFRLELELAHKQSHLSDVAPDDYFDAFQTSLNAALNRPPSAPNPGEPDLPALTSSDFRIDGKMRVSSAMANGLIDVPIIDRVTGYGGAGLGRSWVRAFGSEDGALAWQWMAGVRYAVGRSVELGLKYRYFNSGIVTLGHPRVPYSGNEHGGQTIDVTVNPEIEGEIRSRSLLTTLALKL